MIFDTHCHYNLEPLAADWQKHWSEAQAAGVTKSVIIGTSVASSRLAIEQAVQSSQTTIISMANSSPQLFASLGIHPNFWQKERTLTVASEVEKLKQLISDSSPAQKKLLVAVGEIGLDYFRLDKASADFPAIRQQQIEALELQLELAVEQQLPAILHVRDSELPEIQPPEDANSGNAYWDVLAAVKRITPPKCVLHCASGPKKYVREMLELGAYVGVAGNVTYPSAETLRELLASVPKDRLLLETDAPYLPPKAHRGQVCLPKMIAETAEFVQESFGVREEVLFENAKVFFG